MTKKTVYKKGNLINSATYSRLKLRPKLIFPTYDCFIQLLSLLTQFRIIVLKVNWWKMTPFIPLFARIQFESCQCLNFFIIFQKLPNLAEKTSLPSYKIWT